MRLEDEALHDRLKSLLDSNSRVPTDFAAKRLSMDTDELVDRVKGMRNQYKLIVDGNRIVDSISAYKQSWSKAREKIPASELDVLDSFRERVGNQFIEDGMVAGYRISGGHVISLKLSALDLETLPAPLLNLQSLEHLDVSNNQITVLPESIRHLVRLRHLDIGNNQFKDLPREIARLAHLERLDATCNMLSPLPEAICGIAGLKRLDVSNNKLTILPESISNLKALVELRAAGNYLSRLPECLGTLRALECFDLENNFINVLPSCIENLQKGSLKQLNLAGNPMRGSGENREPWD